MPEMRPQKSVELCARQLQHVERVGRGTGGKVHVAVGRADDEQAAGPQHPADLGEEHLLPIEVLKSFERNDDIKASVGDR